MPPKRAKGLKHAATSVTSSAEEGEPSVKRIRTDTKEKKDSNTDNHNPVYIGEVEEDNEIADAQALLEAAKLRLSSASVDSDAYTEGQTLLRAVLHECSRMLALTTLSDTDRINVRVVYAKSLFWTVAFGTETKISTKDLLDLVMDQIDPMDESKSIQSLHTFLNIAVRLIQNIPVPSDDPAWLTYDDTLNSDINMDDREILAWLILRTLDNEDVNITLWADTCIKLWDSVSNEYAKSRALGTIQLALGSRWITEQGEIAESDETLVDMDVVRKAQESLGNALNLFNKAKDLDDHPSDIIYQPLGDVHVQLATAAEFLDQIDDAIKHYKIAIQYLNQAREHNKDAVDAEMIENLEVCVESLTDEQEND